MYKVVHPKEEPMSTAILGIDVAQATLEVALLHNGQTHQGHFANTEAGLAQLARWLEKRRVRELHVCLEATGRYGDAVALLLHEQGHQVSVVNPAQIHAFARTTLQRNKTDHSDARLIAQFCQLHHPPLWTPPTPEVRALQELVRRLEALMQMRQQEHNRLQSGVTSAVVRATLESHLAYLDEQIAQVEQRIHDHIDQHPDLKRQAELLRSIPGIGAKTAATILGEVGDIQQFAGAPQLAAYAGLTPRQHQSGTSIHRPARLCKTGNAALRKALYFPALSALRFNPIIRALRERLRQAGKRPMQIVGAAMRKLLHLVFGVLKSGRPFDPLHGQTAA
jgi:transposase